MAPLTPHRFSACGILLLLTTHCGLRAQTPNVVPALPLAAAAPANSVEASSEGFPALPATPPSSLGHATPASSSTGAIPTLSGKPRIALLDVQCSADGQPRADLARSIADSLGAKIIKAGSCDLLDATVVQASTVHQSAYNPLSGTATQIGQSLGADIVLLPNCFIKGKSGQLSIRKIEVSTGKVLAVHQAPLAVGEDSLEAAIQQISNEVFPKKAPEFRPAQYNRLREELAAEIHARDLKSIKLATELKEAPKATKAITAAPVAKPASQLVSLGKIHQVVPAWSYCQISCPTPPTNVQPGDELILWSKENPGSTASLRITKVNGDQIFAELPSDPAKLKMVKPGTEAYWEQIR